MNRIFVVPASDRQVRDPQTMQHIPATGKLVPEDTYWVRRIKEGDVVVSDPPASADDDKE